ncbi:AQG_2a_G0055400.mRNA.1.CDS.1 [Saccharomyces cerevisiae]|nr:AAR_G0055140.mRNA.1.CDS.1 [Saccharomyces cerevisiae]CAI4844017.1 AIG_G0054890.mRNA.1.CDS.1 [Saccharomyces cerevisiae]CAI4852145.1 AQG_2a_G0055400.mRNA.1.CDS.1 [Saccharomyces cerevisiae]CAI4856648.1 AEH_G0055270.mRNA.1.CDS.1 [Saccharomyces cerevisiae]CAI5314098.1 CFF_HP2_G0048950.mRNA.1.CDS.1 [Saccharomyces cerevisiae]
MRGMASTETSFLHMAYPSRNGARLIPTGIRQPTKEKRPKRNQKEKKRVGAPRTCKKICIQLLYRFNFSVLGIGNVCNIDLLLGTVSATNAI